MEINSFDLHKYIFCPGVWFPADIAEIRRGHEGDFHMGTNISPGQVKFKKVKCFERRDAIYRVSRWKSIHLIYTNIFSCPGVFGFPQISQKYAEAMKVIFIWAQISVLVR
jgi:hypothetical protein